MNAGRWFGRVAAWAAGHARAVLVVAALLAVAAALGASRIPTDAGVGTLTDADTETYRATQEVRETFGEEPVVVLARGDLQDMILGPDLLQLLRLEGCLSGNAPKGAQPIPGPCAELARLDPVEFVVGPATFLNEAVVQIDRQLRRLSERVSPGAFREFLLSVATRYGITTLPTLDNPEFVATVVFDLGRARGTPKARLSYLFPNSRSAQVLVRLRPDLSESERERALELLAAAVHDATPREACAEQKGKPAPCFELEGGRYVVSGAPVVVEGLADALKEALLVLFAVAIVAMAATLLLVFRSRLRLLPLALALAAAALTFGLLGLTGGSLTMATIAVLPILIGLAVDYAIQLQARFDEAIEAGSSGAEAAREAATAGGPTIATACLATAAGFLALQLSPVPMIRSFGLLLIIGVAVAFALALTAGFAALSLRSSAGGGETFLGRVAGGGVRERSRRTARRTPPPDRTRPPERVGPSAVVAWLRDWTLWLALEHRTPVLAVAVILALAGWGVGTQVETTSDIRELAPQSLQAVDDLNELQETTGVSGELDVSVVAPDLTDPATIEWMAAFKQRVLRENGFRGENPSCLEADICPGPALSDFLARGSDELTPRGIEATLAALSPYALRQVAPLDPESGEIGRRALLSFGIRAQSLEDQQALVDRVRDAIGEPGAAGGPPPGVEVRLAGLPVIAAESATDLSASRYWLTLAGLLAVGLVLLLVYRSLARALIALGPAVLASGWASLILWLSGLPLNPMSAALGALTIAIATQFGVLLSGRFHEERGAGRGLEEALERVYDRTGAAVFASAVTAIAGFAVLIASDVQMLRDFGFVTVIDLAVALVGVMLVLPAALSWGKE